MGKVLAFECEPGPVVGGYGDRIVGLVAVRVLARMLLRKFRVRWTRDDLASYLDYSSVALETKPTLSIKMIDRPEVLRNELRQAPMPFVRNGAFPDVGISVNAEIAQYLFQNPRFGMSYGSKEQVRERYLREMRWAYRTLYTDVLRPTERVTKRMQEVVGDRTGLVGVQVRAGDCFMQTGSAWDERTRYMDGEAGVRAALVGVRRKLDELREAGRVKPGTGIFVTGDHPKVVALAWEVLGARGNGSGDGGDEEGSEGWEVLGDDEPAQHLDRWQSEKLDQTKLYADALVLAQRCSVLFISENSNFGRVAALAGGEGQKPRVGQVFGLDGRELSELELLSKGEKVFM